MVVRQIRLAVYNVHFSMPLLAKIMVNFSGYQFPSEVILMRFIIMCSALINIDTSLYGIIALAAK